MAIKLNLDSLTEAGLTKEEAEHILTCPNSRFQIQALRRYRGPLLDSVHERQQTLDRLDYLIFQLRKNKETASK